MIAWAAPPFDGCNSFEHPARFANIQNCISPARRQGTHAFVDCQTRSDLMGSDKKCRVVSHSCPISVEPSRSSFSILATNFAIRRQWLRLRIDRRSSAARSFATVKAVEPCLSIRLFASAISHSRLYRARNRFSNIRLPHSRHYPPFDLAARVVLEIASPYPHTWANSGWMLRHTVLFWMDWVAPVRLLQNRVRD